MENLLNGYGNGNGNGLPSLDNVTWAGVQRQRVNLGVEFLYDALVSKMDRTALAHKYGIGRNAASCRISVMKKQCMSRIENGDGRLYRQLVEMGLLVPKH